MVKKKRQADHSLAGDSSDSDRENEDRSNAPNCVHLYKAVALPAVKKMLGRMPNDCYDCVRLSAPDPEQQSDYLICLRCGQNRCRLHQERHSINCQVDPHFVALNPQNLLVWCFKCNQEVPSNATKQLLECVEFIRKKGSRSSVNDETVQAEPIHYEGSFLLATLPVPSVSQDGLPKVRGLANLGNTCFLNAVLQCLAQTPFLLPILEEMRKPGERFHLPGGFILVGEEKLDLKRLEGNLREWGPMTACLAETLRELQSGRSEVFVPRELRKLLHEKCPQFAGFGEHDSHELLRQLLDTVRNEDHRRYKTAILELLNLDKKPVRDQITDEQRRAVKAYGRQAGDLLRPSQVFRGELISTLQCQKCLNTTDHIEHFLDLSLPVAADKPIHVRRRVSSEDGQPSKHQLKKERRAAARRSKNKSITSNGPMTLEGQDDVAASDEHSDADNEDESEPRPAQDVIESGYSSEKPGSPADLLLVAAPTQVEPLPGGSQFQPDDDSSSPVPSPDALPADMCGLRVADSSPESDISVAGCTRGVTVAPRVYGVSGECTLNSCLNMFTAQELLTANNKVGCDSCTERLHGKGKTVYTDASKQLLIGSPPAVLILHLKRFQVLRFTSKKNSEQVSFPPVLDLAPFCSVKCKEAATVREGQTQIRYALYGVVQHTGSMHGGHYVAFVKVRAALGRADPRWTYVPGAGGPLLSTTDNEPPDPPPGTWYYVSDSHVSEMSNITVQYIIVRSDLKKILKWSTGALIAQACHATAAVIHMYYDDPQTKEYLGQLDNMHKIVLEVPDETSLQQLADCLSKHQVLHKLWLEQPENIPTCLAVKPYPKSQISHLFKNLKLYKDD